ncbi:MAG: S46 family peptidase [Planctomycetota bacterium]
MITQRTAVRTIALLFALLATSSRADEGMWLFNDIPRDYLKKYYNFEPTEDWAKHVMLSSVRFNSGGSASFVSSNGLVLTNHHVAADTLYKISTQEANYQTDGFLAKSMEEEIKAPDLELNQLVSIEDVTDRVNEAVSADMSTADAFKARRAIMANIEKESLDKTGFRSDVVTLYGGARYHLYRYKKYTDVRVVWAPESAIAFFGGDADNFEYPRYCLDVCLFRVYEDNKPAKIEHFLKWSDKGAGDGELVFVSGNPGRTQRIFTTAALKFLRDDRIPYVLDFLRRNEILMQQFGFEGDEQKRRAKDDLMGLQNSRKAYTGMLQGLQTPAFLEKKAQQENELLAKLNQDPELADLADAWKTIESTQDRKRSMLGKTASFRSQYYSLAESIVHLVEEDTKPSADRLREYRDSARASLEQRLYSPAPIYDDLERVKLADSLARFVEKRGGDNELVKQVLNGKSPRDRAAELIANTILADVDARRTLVTGGKQAIESSNDAMIQLARLMDGEYRRLREENDEIAELERQAYARITEGTVAIEGTSNYPDATFTLRLAFGPVMGYVEDGQKIAPWTTMSQAFDHESTHGRKDPWQLPKSWKDHQDDIAGETPFNFVCTADIIGGNSGSPVINRAGEFVGIIFDGNIQSLTSDFFYSDEVGRAVSVHSAAIIESLRKVYGAGHLADQLGK